MTTINILTRTGRRKSYYDYLKKTIDNQTYKNIRHIKSNDNKECDYLDNEKDVFFIEQDRSLGRGFYNTYLNTLGSKVEDGWIIILDDDSKLIDKNFISNLANECQKSDPNEILIYQIYLKRRKRIVVSENSFSNKIIKGGDLDMACFCIHNSTFKKFNFDGRLMGDYHYVNKIKKSGKYILKFVKLPIGIWANYHGSRNGK